MATSSTPAGSQPTDNEKGVEAQTHTADDAASVHSESSSIQAGVQKALILKKAWSRTTLGIAFASLFITTLIITFSDYSHMLLNPYVTSAFRQHSALSSVNVVGNITRICAFPLIAKLSDVFGRAEMFSFSITVQTLSFILYASSPAIAQYFVAGVFDAIGSTGFTLTQQVFIADATNLVNRAFWSTLPESITTIPALYLGSIIGERFLYNTGWRWGYGAWSIITPICAIPLVVTVALLQRRAKKHGLGAKSLAAVAGCQPSDPTWKKIYHLIWTELDFLGVILLVTGLSLILVPVSLTGSFNPQRWKEGSFIAMLVVGVVLFAAFIVWDLKFSAKPFIPRRMTNRTVLMGCFVQTFDFMSYTLFTIFFPSYLQVAGEFKPAHATRIDNSLRVAFQITGLLVAVGMKYTKTSRYWLLAGPPLVILGQGLMIYLVDSANGTEVTFIVSKVLSGIGRALWQTAGQVSVQAVVPRQDVAVVTGLFQAANSVGGAIGTSVAGAIWRNTLPSKLTTYLPLEVQSNATSIFQSMPVAQSYEPGTPARMAINRAYWESQKILAIVSTCLCVPNLVAMFFMKDVRLDVADREDEAGVERALARIKEKGEGGSNM
ncbi:siderophore iron transporter mirA [Aspergillus karnatakaensis]|uniref:siderophore iron transporter mirA n=1 Tax=Aspergillus karnatakaensis TaxID=1810916 RepID=UPI003CCCCFD0